MGVKFLDEEKVDESTTEQSGVKFVEEPKKSRVPKRESMNFGDPVIPNLTPVQRAIGPGRTINGVGQALSLLFPALQREESLATEVRGEIATDPNLAQKMLLPGRPLERIQGLVDLAGRKNVKGAITGDKVSELGDVLREAGMPEPISALGGLAMSAGLPSNMFSAKILDALLPKQLAEKGPSLVQKTLAQVAGIEEDALKDASKLGFRNVLQKQFFDKKLPAKLAEQFKDNILKFKNVASHNFDLATEQAKKIPFDVSTLKKKLFKVFQVGKKNPFKGANKDLNTRIVEGFNDFNIETFGDALEFRQFFSGEINAAKRQGLDLDFAFKTKKILNEALHKNKLIKTADETWTIFAEQMDEIGDDILKDSGETLLKRFRNLPDVVQKKMITIQKMLGGTNVIDDLVKTSIAKEFIPNLSRTGLSKSNLREVVTLPMFRGMLRASESPIDKALKVAGKQIGKRTAASSLKQLNNARR